MPLNLFEKIQKGINDMYGNKEYPIDISDLLSYLGLPDDEFPEGLAIIDIITSQPKNMPGDVPGRLNADIVGQSYE